MIRSTVSHRGLPISPFQDLMIATALDPETHVGYHQLMTIRWGCRIQPGVSPRAVRRAFEKLVARHDSLRLRFAQRASTWGAEILPEHPAGLVVEDIADLPEDEQTALILKQAAAPKHALSPTLFDMHLYLCGPQGSVIALKAHHSIMDGYGLIVFIEEMLKTFLNIPVDGTALSHRQFVEFLHDSSKRAEPENRRFWDEKLFPLPEGVTTPCLDAHAPVLSSKNMVKSISLENMLSPSQAAALGVMAKDKGVTDFTMLYAAFAKALCEKTSREETFIYSSLSRNDAALSGFIGSCVQNVVIRFSTAWGSVEESAKRLQQEMLNASDHVPVDIFFSLDSAFNNAIGANLAYSSRIRVHRYAPSGRLQNSPFRKIFDAGAQGRISFGGLSIQQLQWPGSGLTLHEIFLSVVATDNGSNGTLVARGDLFGPDDLKDIAGAMVDKLGLSDAG